MFAVITLSSGDSFPVRFDLGARTIDIVFDDTGLSVDGAEGDWDPRRGTIRLQSVSDARSEDWVWHTLGHEIAHAVLEHIGREDLSKDEAFVDTLGGAMIQVYRTFEFPEDSEEEDNEE